MATLKLVNPHPSASYWRCALGTSAAGIPLQTLSYVFSLNVLTANYYDIVVEEYDASTDYLVASFYLNQYLTVGGNYQIDGQTGAFSEIGTTTPPNCPVPSAPTGSVAGAGITFSWSNIPAATLGYEVEIYQGGILWASFSTFQSSIFVDVVLVYKNFPQDGSAFTWRVRARNEAGYSSWSSSIYGWMNFISAALIQVPSAPTLTSPENNAQVPSGSLTLIWQAVSGATQYALWILDTTLGSYVVDALVLANTQYTFTPIDGHQYQWWVEAGNTAGWSADSEYRIFTVGGATIPTNFSALQVSFSIA